MEALHYSIYDAEHLKKIYIGRYLGLSITLAINLPWMAQSIFVCLYAQGWSHSLYKIRIALDILPNPLVFVSLTVFLIDSHKTGDMLRVVANC